MTEPSLFQIPLSTLFLYFILYSFAGWAMETAYCSLRQRRFVMRGFLYGPICPIYGVGALMMVLFFQPLTGNLVLFYVVSTLSMSAWEYFVGWFLETTTHMKYWDYSDHRFNLHGRVSLFVCLWWGVLSYLTIFHIHPVVEQLVATISVLPRQLLALVLFFITLVDAVVTVRHLALAARLVKKLEQVSDELALQSALARAEVKDRLENAREDLARALAEARAGHNQRLLRIQTQQPQLWAKYQRLQELAERHTRHFRQVYTKLSSSRYNRSLRDLKLDAGEIRRRVTQRRQQDRAHRKDQDRTSS